MAAMRTFVCLMLILASATATRAFDTDAMLVPGGVADPNPIECKACEFTVAKVEEYLAKNETVTKIEEKAAELCEKVMPDKAAQCEGLVALGINHALMFVEKNVKPDDVCKEAGACAAVNAVASFAQTARGMSVRDDRSCQLCELVLKEAKSFIDDDDAKEKMKDLCKKLPDDSQSEKCVNIVDKFFPIIKVLLAHASPDFVCEHLHFCEKKTDMAQLAAAMGGVSRPLECVACKFAINQVKEKLTDETVQKKIATAVEGACDSLPKNTLGVECKNIVDKYGLVVLNAVAEKIDDSWCTTAGAC